MQHTLKQQDAFEYATPKDLGESMLSPFRAEAYLKEKLSRLSCSLVFIAVDSSVERLLSSYSTYIYALNTQSGMICTDIEKSNSL